MTEAAGVADRKLYFGFQAVFEDFDNDGWPDLLVANDSNPNYFYRNKRNGSFEETGVSSGIAFSADGKAMSSMGVAAGDYDHDNRMHARHDSGSQRWGTNAERADLGSDGQPQRQRLLHAGRHIQ